MVTSSIQTARYNSNIFEPQQIWCMGQAKLNGLLTFVFVLVIILFSETGYAEEGGKSEISSLIGVRIPPVIQGKKSGRLLGWHGLNHLSIDNANKLSLSVEDGYTENEFGFVVLAMGKDLTLSIIDAKEIPVSLRRYNVSDGKAIEQMFYKKIYDVANCKKANANYPIIGLMHPERNCLHYSKLVKIAWRVNEDTEKLEEIPTKGVRCFFPNAEDDCK